MLMFFGGCTITIDVAASMNGIVIERKTERYLMSSFHGGYSLGTLIGAGRDKIVDRLGQRMVVVGGALFIAVGFMTVVESVT